MKIISVNVSKLFFILFCVNFFTAYAAQHDFVDLGRSVDDTTQSILPRMLQELERLAGVENKECLQPRYVARDFEDRKNFSSLFDNFKRCLNKKKNPEHYYAAAEILMGRHRMAPVDHASLMSDLEELTNQKHVLSDAITQFFKKGDVVGLKLLLRGDEFLQQSESTFDKRKLAFQKMSILHAWSQRVFHSALRIERAKIDRETKFGGIIGGCTGGAAGLLLSDALVDSRLFTLVASAGCAALGYFGSRRLVQERKKPEAVIPVVNERMSQIFSEILTINPEFLTAPIAQLQTDGSATQLLVDLRKQGLNG